MRLTVLLVLWGMASWSAWVPPGAFAAEAMAAEALLGRWRLDLRPTPDAEPYHQYFEVTGVEGKRFSGTFYGTAFDGGIVNGDWGLLQFAFSTADGRTPYHHSGALEGGVLRGRTHAPDRGFLSIWSGERVMEQVTP